MESLGYTEKESETATLIDGESEDVTGLQDNIDAQLSEVFEQFGGDEQDATFKINIYRVQEGRGELGYCFSCVPSELPILDKIQSDFGAGKYEMRLYEKTDKTRLKKRTKFVIEAAKKKPAAPQQQDMSAILAAMAAQQQRSMEQFKELLLMQRPAVAAAPQTSLTELIAAMTGLQNMMPKPAESNNMDMLFKGMELMKDLAGDSGGGREKGLYDMLIEAAKTFGGPIVEMAKNAAPMLPPGAGPVPPGALPPGTVIYSPPGQPGQLENAPPMAVQTEQIQQNEAEQMSLMLTMQINTLVGKAAAGADPAIYADVILDSMSELQIREFIGQPDLKGFLISVNPQVETLWPWFEKLQSEILAELNDAPNLENEGFPATDGQEILTNDETPADTGDIIETETPGLSTDATKPSPKGDATTNT